MNSTPPDADSRPDSKSDSAAEPVVIKKYANRRLYDTGTSAYITLEDLCMRVKDGKEFVVVDAKTGQDLTRQVLTQIILEQEMKGFQVLPTSFLRNVIRFYDDKMKGVLQHYLDGSMKSFMTNQEHMQNMLGKAVEGGLTPFNQLEEITRQNMAMFEKTMQLFNPFGSMFAAKDDDSDKGGRKG
jgi:polyhydroxyalkanoate synthesis repressor PhaR